MKKYELDTLKKTKGTISGVYAIRNTKNKRCYVGISKDIKKRINYHFLELRNNEKKGLFQRDFNEFGISEFFIEILFESENKKILLEKEKEFIKKENAFDEGYNLKRMELEIPKKSVSACITVDLYEIVYKNSVLKNSDIAKWVIEAIEEKIEREDLR